MVISATPTTPKFTPSKYQLAIFDWVSNAKGNGIINAVAGSGKTTVLVEASKLLKTDNALFAAFNKSIAEELSHRLPNMTCKTIHSLGAGMLYKALGKTKLDTGKYSGICKNVVQYNYPRLTWEESGRLVDAVKQLVSLTQATLSYPATEQSCQDIIDHYNIDIALSLKQCREVVNEILEEGIRLATKSKSIDFSDQIWLPNVLDLSVKGYDFIFLDECQDLSKAQLGIIKRCVGKGGRVLAVGDRSQAIYSFAGADSESFDNVKNAFNAVELPLSICYRCPKSHIELAQEIVPQIEAKDNAQNGVIGYISEDKLNLMVHEGDLIISRKTAPLVKLCMSFIARGIAARVKGRDIGKSLTAIVNDVSKYQGFSFANFIDYLDRYRSEKLQKLSSKKNAESQIESLNDRVDSVEAFYTSCNAKSIDGLKTEIESLFSDTRASVTLSTVHRAKGLENDRVFIYDSKTLPLVWKDQLPWQFEQEMNLKYVALTRAKSELYFVSPK